VRFVPDVFFVPVPLDVAPDAAVFDAVERFDGDARLAPPADFAAFVADRFDDEDPPGFEVDALFAVLDERVDRWRPLFVPSPIGSALPTAFSAPPATSPTVPTSLPALLPTSFTTFGAFGIVSSSCIRLPARRPRLLSVHGSCRAGGVQPMEPACDVIRPSTVRRMMSPMSTPGDLPHFNVAADAYDSYMGRYSRRLAAPFADVAGVRAGQTIRVLDVGSGPGALVEELVRRIGEEAVTAVDPSPPFVEAARSRHAGVAVHEAAAESLPFDGASFDAALAQLVVHFMTDPVAGLSEMRRVTRPGGVVAACVWDFTEGHGPLEQFWRAARDLDPSVDDESHRAGARRGHLEELFQAAGLTDITGDELWIEVEHASFQEWWTPFEAGVGPGGTYLGGLSTPDRVRLREQARNYVPDAPFVLRARAWAARGVVPEPRRES
jgi:SAM-dependent methyltransferase